MSEAGHAGDGFCFDNELPRHRVWLEPYGLAERLVTCGEYAEFMEDGGYRRPELWLSDGWNAVQNQGWRSPLYWTSDSGEWAVFTLRGPAADEADEERAGEPGELLRGGRIRALGGLPAADGV